MLLLLELDRLTHVSPEPSLVDLINLPHLTARSLGFLYLGAVLNTLRLHPLGVTFPQSAGLASLPGVLVDAAVTTKLAAVLQFLSDGPPEESLASLARAHAVVLARGVVPAHRAQQRGPALGQPHISE